MFRKLRRRLWRAAQAARLAFADNDESDSGQAGMTEELDSSLVVTYPIRLDESGKNEPYYDELRRFQRNRPVRREIWEAKQRLLWEIGYKNYLLPNYEKVQVFLQGKLAGLDWVLNDIHKIQAKKVPNSKEQNVDRTG